MSETKKLPISTIVITLNEERNIGDCLKSVKDWSDEVFVIDSGSTDKTLEIARRYTDKIYKHPFENFAKQRNWTQDNLPIRNKWVFHLDADERVSPKLETELKNIFFTDNNIDGVMASRKTIFRGKWVRYGGHYPVYHLRVFKKRKGRCEERLYDQHFTVNGRITKIKGDIINIIDSNLDILKAKQKKWAHSEAQEMISCKGNSWIVKSEDDPITRRRSMKDNIYYRFPLFIRPVLYFLYRYVIRLGFLDGKEGFLFHFWQGFWFRWIVDWEIIKLKKKKW